MHKELDNFIYKAILQIELLSSNIIILQKIIIAIINSHESYYVVSYKKRYVLSLPTQHTIFIINIYKYFL